MALECALAPAEAEKAFAEYVRKLESEGKNYGERPP